MTSADDLGRVVIPKEIRRTMRIREGDPLEIYTGAGGEVIFKKYSPIGELSSFASQYAEAIQGETELAVIICDRDHCIAAAGISKKEVLERSVTEDISDIMESRKTFVKGEEAQKIYPAIGIDRPVRVAVPIISAGDVSGAVMLVGGENQEVPESDIKLIKVAAGFLGRQLED